MLKKLVLLGLVISAITQSKTLILPVDAMNDYCLLVHIVEEDGKQRLVVWNSETGECDSVLSVAHRFEYVTLSGSKELFCFIENDILKIKKFSRRSPRSCSFDFPLFNLSFPLFVDDFHIIFCASYNDLYNSGLFLYDISHDFCCPLMMDSKNDYSFPVYMEHVLGFVRRDRDNQVTDFCVVPYGTDVNLDMIEVVYRFSCDEKVRVIRAHESEHKILIVTEYGGSYHTYSYDILNKKYTLETVSINFPYDIWSVMLSKVRRMVQGGYADQQSIIYDEITQKLSFE